MAVLEPGRKLGMYTAVRARFIDDRTEVWEGSLIGLSGFAESVALVVPVSRRPDDLQDFARIARQLEAGGGHGLGEIFAIEGESPPYYACQGFDGPDLLAVTSAAALKPPVDWRSLAALVAAAARGVGAVAEAPLAFEADRIIVFRDEVRVVPTLAVTRSPLPTQLGRLLRALMLNANASDSAIEAVVRRCERDDYPTLEAALPDLDKIAAGRTLADATAWATAIGAVTNPAVLRSPTHPDPVDKPPPKAPTPRTPAPTVPKAAAPPAPTVSLPPPAPGAAWMELAVVTGALSLLLAIAAIAAVGLNIITLGSPVVEDTPRPQRVWVPPPLPPPPADVPVPPSSIPTETEGVTAPR